LRLVARPDSDDVFALSDRRRRPGQRGRSPARPDPSRRSRNGENESGGRSRGLQVRGQPGRVPALLWSGSRPLTPMRRDAGKLPRGGCPRKRFKSTLACVDGSRADRDADAFRVELGQVTRLCLTTTTGMVQATAV